MEVKKWTWSKVVYQSIKVVEDGHIPAQTNLMINGHAQWTIPLRKICQIPALQGPTIPSFSGRDKLRSTCSMLVSILICKSFAVDIRITCSKELAQMSWFTVRRSNSYFSAVTWWDWWFVKNPQIFLVMKRDRTNHHQDSQLVKGVHVARPMRAPHTKPPTGPPGQKRLDVCVYQKNRRSTEIETYPAKITSYWRWDTYHED